MRLFWDTRYTESPNIIKTLKFRSHRRKFSNSDSVEQTKKLTLGKKRKRYVNKVK
jgi:hypothetical protein